jgi:predicted TIM-barrel fold metal-dependent hydrolase
LEDFQDKLLFGTDLDQPNQEIPQLKYLRQLLEEGLLSKKVYDKIMYKNAIKLLNIGSV